MLSAFKGLIEMFSRNNSWLTCLNPCAILSRMQENHKELIFLQKCFISSRCNQKLLFKKREHRFIDISSRNIQTIEFGEEALDGHDAITSRAISGHDPMTRAHFLLDICHLILIGASSSSHVSLYHLLSVRLNRDHLISLKWLTALNYTHALNRDLVNQSPPDRRMSFQA